LEQGSIYVFKIYYQPSWKGIQKLRFYYICQKYRKMLSQIATTLKNKLPGGQNYQMEFATQTYQFPPQGSGY